MARKMTTVGWQGITLKTPEDWSLVGVNGDDKKGYFRVDSPIASAVEVRWSPAFGREPDLMAKGREFLSGLEKSCRKKKTRFSSKIRRDNGAADCVNFSWRSDKLGQGRLRYCRECDRVIIAQVVSARDENISHAIPEMLGSLNDHRGDGCRDWALFGLEVAVPESYRIDRQSLMSGYLSLSFKDKGKTLVIERWGLAGTLLAENSLNDWYRKDVVPDIKGYRIEIADCATRGHAGLKIEGRRSGVRQAAKALAASVTLHPHPKFLTGYAWYCEECNRLFSVRATHADGEDIAERIRDSIECHREKRQ